MSKEKWIQGALQHRGALHKEMGIPEDKTIPEDQLREASTKPGILGERARFAMTLKGLQHGPKPHSVEALRERAKD